MSPHSHSSGTLPSLGLLWKIALTGGASKVAKSRRIQFGISSRSAALFVLSDDIGIRDGGICS